MIKLVYLKADFIRGNSRFEIFSPILLKTFLLKPLQLKLFFAKMSFNTAHVHPVQSGSPQLKMSLLNSSFNPIRHIFTFAGQASIMDYVITHVT